MLTALEGTLKGERSPSPALCQSRHPTWLWGALFAIRAHQAVKGTWGRRKHSIMPKESRYELSSLWEAARQGPCKAQGCFANSLPMSATNSSVFLTHIMKSHRAVFFSWWMRGPVLISERNLSYLQGLHPFLSFPANSCGFVTFLFPTSGLPFRCYPAVECKQGWKLQ